MKNTLTAYMLCIVGFFTGIMGLHRFYLNRSGSGVAQLLTLGGLGVWQFIDLFLIPKMVEESNLNKVIPVSNVSQNQNIVINIIKDEINTNTEISE